MLVEKKFFVISCIYLRNMHDILLANFGKRYIILAYYSSEGAFTHSQTRVNGEIAIKLRINNGGHSQKGMGLLDKYGIKYNIVKTYPNGVRVGNIPEHKRPAKRKSMSQSWFPKTWTEKDIRRAGEHVAGLKCNRRLPDGVAAFGVYKGVRVGIIKTNGKIATVFPDTDQSMVLKRRKKR